ncbi:MAG: MFS transporter [Caulobacteraceae bacterium]
MILEEADRTLASGEIAGLLDTLPARRVWPLVIVVSLGGFFEFYDLMMTGYLSPGIIKAGVFHIGRAGLFGFDDQASFAAATFLGLWIGTLGFARIADRFGRRAIFTFSLLWYSAAGLAMAAASQASAICAARLLAGIGIGVELVTIDAYISEFVPPGVRGKAFAVNQAIQFLAVPAVALASFLLVPTHPFGLAGWRLVPILGASAALFVWPIRARLPESPRWLASRGRTAEAFGVLDRLGAGEARPPHPRTGVAATIAERPSPFAPPWRRRTIVLSVFNLAQAVGFYGFTNWAPSLIAAQGHEIQRSLGYAAAIALAYPVSPLLCSFFTERFERKHQIVIAAIAAALFGLAFSRQSAALAIIALGLAMTFAVNWLSFAFHAYQAECFPTTMRARAVGFVYSWSRISTVGSSFAIAWLLRSAGSTAVFAFIAAAMAVVVVSIGVFGPATRGRSLEAIGG